MIVFWFVKLFIKIFLNILAVDTSIVWYSRVWNINQIWFLTLFCCFVIYFTWLTRLTRICICWIGSSTWAAWTFFCWNVKQVISTLASKTSSSIRIWGTFGTCYWIWIAPCYFCLIIKKFTQLIITRCDKLGCVLRIIEINRLIQLTNVKLIIEWRIRRTLGAFQRRYIEQWSIFGTFQTICSVWERFGGWTIIAINRICRVCKNILRVILDTILFCSY